MMKYNAIGYSNARKKIVSMIHFENDFQRCDQFQIK